MMKFGVFNSSIKAHHMMNLRYCFNELENNVSTLCIHFDNIDEHFCNTHLAFKITSINLCHEDSPDLLLSTYQLSLRL